MRHAYRHPSTRCRRTNFLFKFWVGELSKGTNQIVDRLKISANLIIYFLMKLGKKSGVLDLGFTLSHFGFGSFLNFFEDFLGVFIKIYIKGKLCHIDKGVWGLRFDQRRG